MDEQATSAEEGALVHSEMTMGAGSATPQSTASHNLSWK